MEEIKIRLEHGKIVFAVGETEYSIDSKSFLSMLNKEEMSYKFNQLDPVVKFADLNRVEVAAKYQLLVDRNTPPNIVAEKLGISEEYMNEWLDTIGRDFIERVKAEKPQQFEPLYRGLSAYRTESL